MDQPSTQMQPAHLPPPAEVRTIACLMLNGIGDILCVTPTLQALRLRYPEAKLTVIIRPHLRELLDGNPCVDELLCYETDRKWKRPLFMWRLYRHRFDLWVDLHVPTFNTMSSNRRDFRRNAWLMRASAARFRRAYEVPELAGALSHPLRYPTDKERRETNIVDMTLGLAGPGPDSRFLKHMPVSAADHEWARTELPDSTAPRIALFFGARQPAEIWPESRVLDLIALLGEELPEAELVLIGGEHEAGLAATMAAATSGRGSASLRSFICRANLPRTAALLARCDAFVSTNSGPMHVADAMKVPTVALSSSKNHQAIWRPMLPGSVMLNQPVDCGPCFQSTCPMGTNKCMDLIEPRRILAALMQLLRASGATSRA